MTTIKFSDTELKDLKSFYQLELDKANVRVQDIKGILSKLNSGQTTNGQTVKVGQIKTQRTDNLPDDKQKKITVAGKGLLSKHNSRQTNNGTTVKVVQVKTNQERVYHQRKPWNLFIFDTLKQQNKFLQRRQIYDIALQHFNITSAKEKEMAERNIKGHLKRMSNRNEIVVKTKKGQRANLFGLVSRTDKK